MTERQCMKKRSQILLTADDVSAVMDKNLNDSGASSKVQVVLTDAMAEEEKIVALIEKYMKEGCSADESEEKARQTLLLLDTIFEEPNA